MVYCRENRRGRRDGKYENAAYGRSEMEIRRAEKRDLEAVEGLLSQVLEVHARIRPDLFIPGTRKYTSEELLGIFADDSRPVFVWEEDGRVKGYCFCVLQETPKGNCTRGEKTLYIDDLCVDRESRGKRIGGQLCDYAIEYAGRQGCSSVTLNVWEGNDTARAFYQRAGFTPRKTMLERKVQKIKD